MNPDLTQIVTALNRLVVAQHKGWLEYTNTGLVLVTLGVLIWYTVETARLRSVAQEQTSKATILLTDAQRQNETAVKPMFAIYISVVLNKRQVTLENVGLGPAFNVKIGHPEWDGNRLTIWLPTNVMKPGQTEALTFGIWDGTTGVNLPLKELEVDTGRIPNPFQIVIRCVSVDGKPYEYAFQCTLKDGHLQTMFIKNEERSVS